MPKDSSTLKHLQNFKSSLQINNNYFSTMYCIILYKTYIFTEINYHKMESTLTIKKILLALFLVIAASTVSFAQCDKPVTLVSSLTTYLNAKSEVEKTKDEETVITLSKTEITIIPGDESHKVSGAVKSYICSWPVPYKEGKTVATALLTDGGRDMHATITITGKDGKVTLTFEAEELPGKRILVIADKFE
jgi:hypothetical protein